GAVTAELVLERELEAVLAFAVGRHEAEQRAAELAVRIEAMPFAFDRETAHRITLRFVAERAHREDLGLRDAALEPREATAPRELLDHLGHRERERLRDALGVLLDAHRDILLFDAAEELDRVDRHARHLDALRERRPVAVVDGPALRRNVEPSLALLLGEL